MQKVVNITVLKNNTFCEFYKITTHGVVFYHPSGLTVVVAVVVVIAVVVLSRVVGGERRGHGGGCDGYTVTLFVVDEVHRPRLGLVC